MDGFTRVQVHDDGVYTSRICIGWRIYANRYISYYNVYPRAIRANTAKRQNV